MKACIILILTHKFAIMYSGLSVFLSTGSVVWYTAYVWRILNYDVASNY